MTGTQPDLAAPRSLYAHEVVPWPGEEAPFTEHVRYALARATGFWLRFMDDLTAREYVNEAIYTGQHALLLVALHDGLAGEDAYRWMWERSQDGDIGEWLWELGTRFDIDVQAIKGYDRDGQPKASNEVSPP